MEGVPGTGRLLVDGLEEETLSLDVVLIWGALVWQAVAVLLVSALELVTVVVVGEGGVATLEAVVWPLEYFARMDS